MADTALTPVELALNEASANIAIAGGTAINAANTMSFDFEKDEKYLLLVNNTFAGAKDVTIAAGFGWESGQGALVASLAQNDVKAFHLSSARFKNASGKISISFASSMTGFVRVLKLP